MRQNGRESKLNLMNSEVELRASNLNAKGAKVFAKGAENTFVHALPLRSLRNTLRPLRFNQALPQLISEFSFIQSAQIISQ